MAIHFVCENCGRSYTVRDEYAGKKLKCKNEDCGVLFIVPDIKTNEEFKDCPSCGNKTKSKKATCGICGYNFITSEKSPFYEETNLEKDVVTASNLQNLHSLEIENKILGVYYCPKCGSRITNNATECPKCGYISKTTNNNTANNKDVKPMQNLSHKSLTNRVETKLTYDYTEKNFETALRVVAVIVLVTSIIFAFILSVLLLANLSEKDPYLLSLEEERIKTKLAGETIPVIISVVISGVLIFVVLNAFADLLIYAKGIKNNTKIMIDMSSKLLEQSININKNLEDINLNRDGDTAIINVEDIS